MTDLLTRLLDIETLRLGAEGVGLGFERPIPAWAWGGIVGAAVLLGVWSYTRLAGPAWGRLSLGLLRAGLLIVLMVLISGPQLVQRSESVERDWVLVLADRSASMTIADVEGEGASRRTRDAQLRSAVGESRGTWEALSKGRVVQWLGFAEGAFELGAGGAEGGTGPVDFGEPTGRRTSLGPALDQALARAAARPLAAVVVLSDGRSVSEPTRGALRRLQSDRVPVFAVPLGSAEPVSDVAVRRVDVPRLAFVDDVTPVRVELEKLGGEGSAAALVRLVDRATGQVLDERRVEMDESSASVVLTTRSDQPGARTWGVEVIPEGTDLIAGNNAAEAAIELVDRPMRLLYIDGYPRWEQRYLKNLMIREKSIVCSTLLLSPQRRYLQEGDVEIDALPSSIEEWAAYDAVVLGDVSPEVFTDEQMLQLREHVSRRGAGLLWIAGEAATPMLWFDTPLGDLLPFGKEATDGSAVGAPVHVTPTATARRLGLLQLGESADEPWPAELADGSTAWSALRWAQRLDRERLKPTAEVLAETTEDGWPLVLSMRYGAGRVLYVATDEIWRWRYGRGETLPERFWLQMLRLQGRESLSRAGRSATLELTPRRTDVEQPVRVAVELLDQQLADGAPGSLAVRVTRKPGPGDGPGGATAAELVLRPEQGDRRTYAAIWLAPEAGTWVAEPVDALLAGMGLSAEAVISLPDDELRHPETDHGALARLAEETGGAVLEASDLSSLPERIPNRSLRLLNETTESLWDTPLALLVVVLLATLEWVGRRVIRLI
ncbi:MAG: hypothetical protein SFZ24_06475 [Planctomycetota bacterium]|nr:hypothetical protein [Planctomycetota bacterium]